jgi:hypothetical protein
MLKKKYSCFENTNIYRTYSDLLDDAELIDVEHSDFFEQLICDLRCDVGCNVSQPTEDQINNYIQNNEIEESTIPFWIGTEKRYYELHPDKKGIYADGGSVTSQKDKVYDLNLDYKMQIL